MSNNIMSMSALADELAALISATVPKSQTVKKYGGTLFTLKPDEKEGQFCGVFVHKAHVQISFSKGAQLDDPNNLLSGNGKLRRHVNVSDSSDIDTDGIKKLLKQASKL